VIHHEICDGLGMRSCESCARHIDRFSKAVQAATTTRLKPLATPPRCVDWLEAPQRAIDSTHSTL
jgi:hypothetical protein